jgi:hypothetical protein
MSSIIPSAAKGASASRMALFIAGTSSPSRSEEDVDIDQHAFDQTLDRNGIGPLDTDGMCSGETPVGEKRLMVARRPIALPAIAHGVESLEPWVAPAFGACRAADQNASARGTGAIKRRSGELWVEPVNCAADTDNVECAELRGGILEPALDESHRDVRALRRLARCLDHPRLRIDTDHLVAIRRKADRQNARPGADIEKTLTPVQPHLERNGFEKRCAIGRPGAFIIGDGGGEASHGDPWPASILTRAGRDHETAASTWRPSTSKINRRSTNRDFWNR